MVRGRRAHPARLLLARAGSAELGIRRLSAPARRRHRRLGRRLAGHDRPRQPGGAVARDRAVARGDAVARARARAAPTALPGARGRHRALGRPGRAARGAPRLRCSRPGARGQVGTGRARCRAVPRPPRRGTTRVDRRGARGGGARASPRSPRPRARAGHRRGRPPPPGGVRRRGQLRRHPQHPVHERLLLQVWFLRLLEREARREPAWTGLPRADGGDRAARRSRRGSAAPPRYACRAASIPRSPATTTPTLSR